MCMCFENRPTRRGLYVVLFQICAVQFNTYPTHPLLRMYVYASTIYKGEYNHTHNRLFTAGRISDRTLHYVAHRIVGPSYIYKMIKYTRFSLHKVVSKNKQLVFRTKILCKCIFDYTNRLSVCAGHTTGGGRCSSSRRST